MLHPPARVPRLRRDAVSYTHLALGLPDQQQRANKYAHEIVPIMEKLRAAVDEMEVVTDRDHWPVPTYNDMLFYV